MTIRRGTFTYTFLFDDNIDSEEYVRSLTVEGILENCDTEHMLGSRIGELVIVEVPNEEVAAAEISLGSDGEFFADPDALWDQKNGQDGAA